MVEEKNLFLLRFSLVQYGHSSGGNLRFLIAGGEIVLGKPRIYQMTASGPSHRKSIAGGYVLKASNRRGFQVGEYDRGQPLIVDPVLSYSNYFGPAGSDLTWRLHCHLARGAMASSGLGRQPGRMHHGSLAYSPLQFYKCRRDSSRTTVLANPLQRWRRLGSQRACPQLRAFRPAKPQMGIWIWFMAFVNLSSARVAKP